MTIDERASIENGIWLCAVHATLIDRDVEQFPAELLIEFKRNHEYKVRLAQGGFPVGRPGITAVRARGFGQKTLNAKLVEVQLGRGTIFRGANATGKSMICDIIASMADPDNLARWSQPDKLAVAEVDVFTGEPVTYRIEIDNDGPRYFVDNQPLPLIKPGFHIIYLRKTLEEATSRSLPVLQRFAEHLAVPVSAIKSLIDKPNLYPGLVADLESDPEGSLSASFGGSNPRSISYLGLSGGEKHRVVVEIAIRLARVYSKMVPTVLILDQWAFPTIDHVGVSRLLEVLSDAALPFQSVVILASNYEQVVFPRAFPIWEFSRPPAGIEVVRIMP